MTKNSDPESPHPRRGLALAWKKAQRRLRRGVCTLAAALAFGAGGAAAAQTAAPPAPVAAAATDTAQKDYAHSQERLDRIEAKMRRSGTGAALLKFAGDYGITIQMSNGKVMNTSDGYTIDGTYGTKRIRLNGDEKSDDEIMLTLAHELRHAWHDLVIRESSLRLDPRRDLIKNRILEADVFAMQSYFAFEYEKATGEKLALGGRADPCGDDEESSLCMLSGYAADRDAGMEAAKAYGRLFDKTLEHVQWEDYDTDFLKSQDDNWQSVIDAPETGGDYFGNGDAGLTSDTDFVAAMRRATTPAMDADKGTSGLADWKDADFTSLDKTGGSPKSTVEGLKKEQVKFDAARKAWSDFRTQQQDDAPKPRVAAGGGPSSRWQR